MKFLNSVAFFCITLLTNSCNRTHQDSNLENTLLIASAIESYFADYKEWPYEDDSSTCAKLFGNNSMEIPYLIRDEFNLDKDRNIVDMNGHRYQFYFSRDGFVIAGPGEDEEFNSSDDFVYFSIGE